ESHAQRSDGIVYSREQLVALCGPVLLPGARHEIPEELRRLKSDHNLVFLAPKYVPLVQRQPVSTRTVRKWTPEANEALQDCFETTDWD
ncbi:Modification methylase LlaDCHIA, partial [Dissostichus eleginoides]